MRIKRQALVVNCDRPPDCVLLDPVDPEKLQSPERDINQMLHSEIFGVQLRDSYERGAVIKIIYLMGLILILVQNLLPLGIRPTKSDLIFRAKHAVFRLVQHHANDLLMQHLHAAPEQTWDLT